MQAQSRTTTDNFIGAKASRPRRSALFLSAKHADARPRPRKPGAYQARVTSPPPARAEEVAAPRQPEPAIPGLTKPMVMRQLNRLVPQRNLDHSSPTQSEWRLAEYSLARELKFSPLRIAFFVSESLNPEGGSPVRAHWKSIGSRRYTPER